jgi:hypothetical protein
VTNLVGSGFQAYARLLHPLDDHPGPLTWATVARANGRILHPSVQWEKISSPAPLSADGLRQPSQPRRGHLDTWALEALCAILAQHTATPQTCYFAAWEGRGQMQTMLNTSRAHSTAHAYPQTMSAFLREDVSAPSTITANYDPDRVVPKVQPAAPAPVEWQLDLSAPTFSLPAGLTNYYLYEGHVGDAVRLGYWVNTSLFVPHSPNFFWPADNAWCVTTWFGYDSTFIGGSRELVDELCASEALEVLEIAPDAPSEDHVNR